MADTRRDKRAPVSLKVRFKSATVDEFIEHYSRDVSNGGIFIKSSQPLAIGTLLKFQFQLKDESALIRGVGRVVWTRAPEAAQADQPAGMGVKFIKIDDESRAMVARVVDGLAEGVGEFEAGRATATAAERPSAPASDYPPDSVPPSEPPGASLPPLSISPSDPPAAPRPPAAPGAAVEPVSPVSASQPPAAPAGGEPFFPPSPPATLPPPEDRTEVRQAAQFLAAALSEGGSDPVAAAEAEAKAAEARARSAEIEAKRRAELDASERARALEAALPSMIVDESVAAPSLPRESPAPRRSTPSDTPAPSRGAAEATYRPQATEPLILERPAAQEARPAPTVDASHDAMPAGKPAVEKGRSPLVPVIVLAAVVGVAAFVALRGSQSASEQAIAVAPSTTPEAMPEPSPEATPEPSPEATPEPTPAPEPEATPEPSPGPEATPEPSPAPEPTPVAPTPAPAAAAEPAHGGAPVGMVAIQIRTSPKSLKLLMNGKPVPGREPLVQLPVGVPVVFKASAPGRFSEERTVTPSVDSKVERFFLTAKPFVVNVTSDPPGARIAAGTRRADAPARIDLADSVHGPLVVQARLPGYQLGRITVQEKGFTERADAMEADLAFKLLPQPAGAPAEPDAEAGSEPADAAAPSAPAAPPASDPAPVPTPAP